MNNYPARTASLREAADVLRTYRRAAGGERKTKVNAKMGFLQQFMHQVQPAIVRKKRGQKACQELSPDHPGGL